MRLLTKLKTFGRTYFRTISDPDYYNEIIAAKFSFSLKYFLMFFVFFSIATGVYIWIFQSGNIRTSLNQHLDYIAQTYPDNLVLEFSDGVLSAQGVDQPYSVPLVHPYFWSGRENFLTINTVSEESADAFVVLYRDRLVLQPSNGESNTLPYEFIGYDFRLDKATFLEQLPLISEQINLFLDFYPLANSVFILSFYMILTLLFLLVLSFFVYIVSQFGKASLTYVQSYQVSLHTITFAETARFLQRVLFADMNLPSIYGWAFFGATALVLLSLKRKSDQVRRVRKLV